MGHVAAHVESSPLKVRISGMDCGSCAMTIESSMRQLPGVESASVSFTTETMDVEGDVSLDDVAVRIKELGYRVVGDDEAPKTVSIEHRGFTGFLRFLWDQRHLRRAVVVTAAVVVGLAVLPGVSPVLGVAPLDILFAAAVLIAGAPVFLKGFRALVFARSITIDILMAIAAFGAIGIGATGEAVTVVLLFMLGEALEAYSAERARDSLRSLMALQPQEATVLRAHDESHGEHDHSGHDHAENDHSLHDHDSHDQDSHDHSNHDHHEQESHDHTLVLPIEQVVVGDRVLVRPGQRIPVDGDIISGMSSINQAPVTGESVPVTKTVGEVVMAGTVNGEAALGVRVSRLASDGTIARIARLVEQAQAQRSPAERFTDRFARWYTPAVVLLALAVALVPVLILGQPLMDYADGSPGWLYRGLALLIIACPCALVISIPVTVVSGLTRLAHLGVLVKGGAQLDRLADVTTVAFDKTGTLTYGQPKVTDIRAIDCGHEDGSDNECEPCDNLVTLAATVERHSEHPVAAAIVEEAQARLAGVHLQSAEDVTAVPGRGVRGTLASGAKVAVGNAAMFEDTLSSAQFGGWQDAQSKASSSQDNGNTVLYVAQDNKILGHIGVQDQVRDATRNALAELDALSPRVQKIMLTGDTAQSAQRVVDKTPGIDAFKAGLLPDEKLNAIEDLKGPNGAVAMVGDGINDAPALASADIGFAMGGGGTAQAIETADVVLMQDDLSHVPMTLRLARKSRAIVKQNIILSLGLKLAFLALVIPGLSTLWMAVMADVGATLIVTLNGMRLLREP